MPVEQSIEVVVVGAGQCGLAASAWLRQLGIGHVVLERGSVGESWRSQRWDSLRLLTLNGQNRLPGWEQTTGEDPDGFASMAQTAQFLEDYARHINAPVLARTPVLRASRSQDGYRVETPSATFRAKALVIASGAFSRPQLPRCASDAPASITQLSALDYRRPELLPPGGVLVVGAAASGLQIADELRRHGHEVTLAVGEHVRIPRRYRGKDIQWWLESSDVLDEGHTQVDDIVRARHLASFQLVGDASREIVDLNALRAEGVRLVGRLAAFGAGGKAQFSGALANVCALADIKLKRLLDRFDQWAEDTGCAIPHPPGERPSPTIVDARPALQLDLEREGIGTILWAAGMRPNYDWLDVPVLDHKGLPRHEGGITDIPGLYVLGLPLLRRRRSSLIGGAGDDAREICGHLHAYLAGAFAGEPRPEEQPRAWKRAGAVPRSST